MNKHYNCKKCPAYCCSYEDIPVTSVELQRIAAYFGVSFHDAKMRFTRKSKDDGRMVLRHQSDDVFQSVCIFLDRKTRRCTIYDARPLACRDYPESPRCGYYELLKQERKRQKDRTIQIRVDW